MSKYTYEKLYLLKTFLSDNKSIDAAKQPRYDLIIAYASRYKARISSSAVHQRLSQVRKYSYDEMSKQNGLSTRRNSLNKMTSKNLEIYLKN